MSECPACGAHQLQNCGCTQEDIDVAEGHRHGRPPPVLTITAKDWARLKGIEDAARLALAEIAVREVFTEDAADRPVQISAGMRRLYNAVYGGGVDI